MLNARISIVSRADPSRVVTACNTETASCWHARMKTQAGSEVRLLPEYRAFAFMIGAWDASWHTLDCNNLTIPRSTTRDRSPGFAKCADLHAGTLSLSHGCGVEEF